MTPPHAAILEMVNVAFRQFGGIGETDAEILRERTPSDPKHSPQPASLETIPAAEALLEEKI